MKYLLLTLLFSTSLNNQISAQIPPYVPSDGLIGWWPFKGNADDESGNGIHGTVNGASPVADRFGNANSAYGFNGIDNNIFIDSSFFDNGWDNFSISGWYYLNALSNLHNINQSNTILNTSPHRGLAFEMNWGNLGKYSVLAGSGTPASDWNAVNAFSGDSAAVGSWTFVTLVKTASVYSLYVNGVQTETWQAAMPVQPHFYKMYFGSTDPVTITEVIDGNLDDIGIWNRALTETEISGLYLGTDISSTDRLPFRSMISVWPNPTHESITLDCPDYPGLKCSQVSICNATGQEVFRSAITRKQSFIDISALGGDGIYVVRIMSSDGVTSGIKKVLLLQRD